jgi:glycosyltransferase involved in cell wall biosynthesis
LEPDLVHTHSSKPGVLGRLAAWRVGVPRVVHHVHAFAFHDYSPPHRRWIYSQIERLSGATCDRVVFVNQEERQLAIDRRWIGAEKCLTVYNGVRLDRLDPSRDLAPRHRFRDRLGIAASEMVVLLLGRLEYPKQPLLVAEIAEALAARRPEGRWRIVVVGAGDEHPALVRRIAELRLENRVLMPGWLDDPRDALMGADVMLQTSLAEGLPMTLIEAAAVGMAAVASDAKGNREVVTPRTGILCSPKDPLRYADALVGLLDDPAYRIELGAAARQRAVEMFDARKNNRRIIELYDELLGVTSLPATRRRAA